MPINEGVEMSVHEGMWMQVPSFYHSGVSNSCEGGKIPSCAWVLHFKIVILSEMNELYLVLL